MKKSMCCNEDMIYCGKGKSPVMTFVGAYIYMLVLNVEGLNGLLTKKNANINGIKKKID